MLIIVSDVNADFRSQCLNLGLTTTDAETDPDAVDSEDVLVFINKLEELVDFQTLCSLAVRSLDSELKVKGANGGTYRATHFATPLYTDM